MNLDTIQMPPRHNTIHGVKRKRIIRLRVRQVLWILHTNIRNANIQQINEFHVLCSVVLCCAVAQFKKLQITYSIIIDYYRSVTTITTVFTVHSITKLSITRKPNKFSIKIGKKNKKLKK